MMNNQYWLVFLYQKTRLRYGSVFILSLLIAFFMYYLFIIPINNQCKNEQSTYQTLLHDIAQLEQQILTYPKQLVLVKEQQRLTQLLQQVHFSIENSGNIIANLPATYHLKLIDFSREEINKKRQFNLQLEGNYSDFLQFVAQLSQLTLAIKIIHLSIHQHNKQLIYTLSIISEYKSTVE